MGTLDLDDASGSDAGAENNHEDVNSDEELHDYSVPSKYRRQPATASTQARSAGPSAQTVPRQRTSKVAQRPELSKTQAARTSGKSVRKHDRPCFEK